jgi:site-specific DNA recombinase
MTTAAMYARASSASQKEEETIVSQTAELKGYAISLGLVVPLDWIFEDEGFSGSTLIRQPWSGCETWSLRSTSGCYSAMHPIAWPEDTPIRCCSWKSLPAPERKSAFSRHRPGDTPEAALLVQVQGVIAEYEKAQILERTRRARCTGPRPARSACSPGFFSATVTCARGPTRRRATRFWSAL